MNKHQRLIELTIYGDKTDKELAVILGCSPQRVYQMRKELNIRASHKRNNLVKKDTLELPSTTYTDENGQTITRYGMGYAIGAFITSITARPRR